MNEDLPERDDPIHRIFKRLRDGFSDVVVNLAERVERRIRIFVDDQRHQQPDFEQTAHEGLMDVVGVFSGFARAHEEPSVRADDSALGDPSDEYDET